jgi:hypothetical protein
MPLGLVQPPIVHRAQTVLDSRIQKVCRHQALTGQLIARKITPARLKVLGQIPQDIDQLETLAETDAIGLECRVIE